MAVVWTIQSYDELPSTQSLLKQRAAEGAPEGLVVEALRQSSGYGRQGRVWVSPLGNLYLSLLLRPACAPQIVSQIALVAGVALANCVSRFADGALLKWPNDLFMNGRKLAGILLETEMNPGGEVEWLALGVGVNIASNPLETGIALRDVVSKVPALKDFRDSFLENLAEVYTLWQTRGLEEIRTQWLENAHPSGTPLSVKLGGQPLDGYFEGLDATGNLLLRLKDGTTRVIASGEVHFGDRAG